MHSFFGCMDLSDVCRYVNLSTVSSSVNALAAVTLEDLIKPYTKMSEKHLSWTSKGLSEWIVFMYYMLQLNTLSIWHHRVVLVSKFCMIKISVSVSMLLQVWYMGLHALQWLDWPRSWRGCYRWSVNKNDEECMQFVKVLLLLLHKTNDFIFDCLLLMRLVTGSIKVLL